MAEATTWGISSQSPTIIKKFDFMGESNVIIGSAAGMPGSGFFPSEEEAKANALKMAAAPQLLAELKTTTFLLTSACLLIEEADARKTALTAVKRARDAIAKATGSAA